MMRKNNTEFTQEVFQRSEKRKRARENRWIFGTMGVIAAGFLLFINLHPANSEKVFGPEVVSAFVYNPEEECSLLSTDAQFVEKLLAMLNSYTEVEVSNGKYEMDEKESHYFMFTDFNGVDRTYKLYSDGTLVCSNGVVYQLEDAQVQELTGEVEENFFQNQSISLGQYASLLQSFNQKNTNSQTGKQVYDDNYGGAYIDDNGELVVLLVEITEGNIKEIQEAIHTTVLKVEDCEYPYNEMMAVIDGINARLGMLSYADISISEMYEDVYTNRVYIKVPNLTPEKEAIIRGIVDSPCMVIEDSASEMVVSPLADEDLNQLPTVSITIAEDSVTPTSLTACISYAGDGEMMYGESYYLEGYKEDGNWYRLSSNGDVFLGVGYPVFSGQTREETYDWKWRYETLEPGRYRIIIDYMHDDAEGNRTDQYMAAEFEIK